MAGKHLETGAFRDVGGVARLNLGHVVVVVDHDGGALLRRERERQRERERGRERKGGRERERERAERERERGGGRGGGRGRRGRLGVEREPGDRGKAGQ